VLGKKENAWPYNIVGALKAQKGKPENVDPVWIDLRKGRRHELGGVVGKWNDQNGELPKIIRKTVVGLSSGKKKKKAFVPQNVTDEPKKLKM